MKQSDLETYMTPDESRVFESVRARVNKEIIVARETLLKGRPLTISMGSHVPMAAIRNLESDLRDEGWVLTVDGSGQRTILKIEKFTVTGALRALYSRFVAR